MLKTFAAVLIAASMLSAPAFAQNTSPAPQTPAAQAVKAPAVKVVEGDEKHTTMKQVTFGTCAIMCATLR